MQQHSAVPLSVADPSRESTAHSPPSRADAVTGINRPRLLASSFSRRLQGDFHAPLLSVLHQPTALFAETEGLLVLIHAKHIQLPIHNIMFSPFVNGVFGVFFLFLCQKESPAQGCICQIKVDTKKHSSRSPVRSCTELGFYNPRRPQASCY